MTPYYRALLALCLPLMAHAEVSPPYQSEGETVLFKPYGNQPGQPLAKASPTDFEVIYRGDDFSLAASQGRHYCNERLLPAELSLDNAKALGSFLLSGSQAYAYCERVAVKVDTQAFRALSHPFYSDGRHVFLVTGEVLSGADPKSLKTGHGQAADRRHYYYVADKTVVIPHQGDVRLHDTCQGWATLDGILYFEGEKQPEVDGASFHCLNFSSAVTKDGFYSGKQKVAPLPAGVDSARIKALSDQFVTDGQRVWSMNLRLTELEGVNLDAAEIDYAVLSDGTHRWDCGVHDEEGNPTCEKSAL
ncbi:DKNYY domain-containing protein [Aeromonas diversa]|uniref:DKNYY domain-containing protein n=1 Tax=Aeromonas diversa TaxID=502790 RepID=UPI00399F6BFE